MGVNRLAKHCSDLNDGRHHSDGRHDSHKDQALPFNRQKHGVLNGHRQSAEARCGAKRPPSPNVQSERNRIGFRRR